LQSLKQMRNRGNNKGGGIAAVGLIPEELGVTRDILEKDYLLVIAYLDPSWRVEVERQYIEPTFEVDHVRGVPTVEDYKSIPGLEIKPPEVFQYFVRVRSDVFEAFKERNGLENLPPLSIEDEIVYQNSYNLNRRLYASTGEKRAFVLSHGKNMLVLKMVGYGDDVIRYYKLENFHAHVWIGHHRYPTKGRVWHPGGAHPFVGLHEALVHNGDFANYASICEYLAQRNIHPLFLTDTEVSVLVFDLLHRTYGYPLEYVIEALAPTTERDFSLLPPDKQRIYHMLQTTHIHGSPDGPWFFLIAQSVPREKAYRLIGITDTSMLRPQVFALQQGRTSIGFAASEKQAIDAALESLASEDPDFWPCADRYWNARGGSHTDGGAFIFTIRADRDGEEPPLLCTDKFGRLITIDTRKRPLVVSSRLSTVEKVGPSSQSSEDSAEKLFQSVREQLAHCSYEDLIGFLEYLTRSSDTDSGRRRSIEVLTLLMDRRYPTGNLRRSSLLALYDQALEKIFDSIAKEPSELFTFHRFGQPRPRLIHSEQTVVIDARGFPAQGENSLALEVVRLHRDGFWKILISAARGHRFIGNGLGPNSHGVRIDVYGSSGDYLASGIDGAEIYVHGNGQDQLAQIMKSGRLVVFGDVGQTFLYAAKGGYAYILGNAAGRPLINAVGKPRVIINGTCLDYLAESFMAGDPLSGGGFVILNGISFDEDGNIIDLASPYPGANLFSLASGGAIYLRDPHETVSEVQLNGGEFADLTERDWNLIEYYLEVNEELFGIPVHRLLQVDGRPLPPEKVYRKSVLVPFAHCRLKKRG